MFSNIHNSSRHQSSTISEVAELLSSLAFFRRPTLPGSVVKCCFGWSQIFFVQRLMSTISKTLLTLYSFVIWPEGWVKARLHARLSGAAESVLIDGELNFLWTSKCHFSPVKVGWQFFMLELSKWTSLPVPLLFILHGGFCSIALFQIRSSMSLT